MKFLTLLFAATALVACGHSNQNLVPPHVDNWTQAELQTAAVSADIENWYQHFNDPVLNQLVELALADSPTRNIAAARVAEARGLRRTARAEQLPNVGVNGTAREQDNGTQQRGSFEAGFDASFELDVFGAKRNRAAAAIANADAIAAQYNDITLTLVAEVARIYTALRAAERNVTLANNNVASIERTAKLVKLQYKQGAAGRLDVERINSLLNSTRAQLPQAERIAEANRLALGALVGVTPSEIKTIFTASTPVPQSEVLPILQTPAEILAQRPDVRAARLQFIAATETAEAAVGDLWPTFTLGGFFGIAEGALFDPTEIWTASFGTAVSLLDFGRLEGQVDAARARERIAFETYRQTILNAVAETETALSDYARLSQEQVNLAAAFRHADSALNLSKTLHEAGEIGLLDVLDAERTAITAEQSLVAAQDAQTQALIRLYKAMGVV